jgi:outer membrane protein
MKYFFNILLLLCLLVLGFYVFSLKKQIKRVAFVDTASIFNDFEMKKELEVKYKSIADLRKKQLDSLYDVADTYQKTGDQVEFKKSQELFFTTRKNIESEQERLKSGYDTQIWEKINFYIKAYGTEQDYDLILGANGQGSIMHGKDDMNVSADFLKYLNKKYNGE